MNVTNHISETLDLPLPFVQESVVHDPAHRVEVAANDVKKREKDIHGNIKVPETKWLIELDNVLQHIMVKCNYGANHSEL